MARFSTLEKLLGTAVGIDLVRPGTTRKVAVAAAKSIAALARPQLVPAAQMVGRAGLAGLGRAGAATLAVPGVPVAAGGLLGAAALETDPGQRLLELAAERGAADRIRLEQAIDERIFAANRALESPTFQGAVRTTARRKATKYSKAVKAGMAAVKKSKFIGSPGRINNAKKAFGTVNKVVSKVNKGLKPAKKGVSGVISRAVKGILK
jgi:hypothetical protein